MTGGKKEKTLVSESESDSSIECMQNSLKISTAASLLPLKRQPLKRPKNKPGMPKDFVFVDLSPVKEDATLPSLASSSEDEHEQKFSSYPSTPSEESQLSALSDASIFEVASFGLTPSVGNSSPTSSIASFDLLSIENYVQANVDQQAETAAASYGDIVESSFCLGLGINMELDTIPRNPYENAYSEFANSSQCYSQIPFQCSLHSQETKSSSSLNISPEEEHTSPKRMIPKKSKSLPILPYTKNLTHTHKKAKLDESSKKKPIQFKQYKIPKLAASKVVKPESRPRSLSFASEPKVKAHSGLDYFGELNEQIQINFLVDDSKSTEVENSEDNDNFEALKYFQGENIFQPCGFEANYEKNFDAFSLRHECDFADFTNF